MQVQVDIDFDQLVQIAKKLPAKKWSQLKEEVEQKKAAPVKKSNLEQLLVNGPVFSKKQLDEIKKTRKALNQWRKTG
jgi:hypothetical protein